MKKALFLIATLAIMFMANVNVKATCPPGWSGPITNTYQLKCTWIYSYCYYYDVNTGEYSININTCDAVYPCRWLEYEGGTWFQIRKALRDSLIVHIFQQLTAEIWTEIEIPRCPQNLCFWFVNEPACYKVEYQGYEFKHEKCTKSPRPCNRAIVTICWDYIRDIYGNIVYINGVAQTQTIMTRTWYPALNPNGDYYVCLPFEVPLEPMCYDNCY